MKIGTSSAIIKVFVFLILVVNVQRGCSETIESESSATSCKSESSPDQKPTALLASPLKVNALLSFLSTNHDSLIGKKLITPGEIHDLIKFDSAFSDLDIEKVPDSLYGGDIVIAEKILSGQISKVVFFYDSPFANYLPDSISSYTCL